MSMPADTALLSSQLLAVALKVQQTASKQRQVFSEFSPEGWASLRRNLLDPDRILRKTSLLFLVQLLHHHKPNQQDYCLRHGLLPSAPQISLNSLPDCLADHDIFPEIMLALRTTPLDNSFLWYVDQCSLSSPSPVQVVPIPQDIHPEYIESLPDPLTCLFGIALHDNPRYSVPFDHQPSIKVQPRTQPQAQPPKSRNSIQPSEDSVQPSMRMQQLTQQFQSLSKSGGKPSTQDNIYLQHNYNHTRTKSIEQPKGTHQRQQDMQVQLQLFSRFSEEHPQGVLLDKELESEAEKVERVDRSERVPRLETLMGTPRGEMVTQQDWEGPEQKERKEKRQRSKSKRMVETLNKYRQNDLQENETMLNESLLQSVGSFQE